MKNTLFLFTADFPYGSGETFLETEIKYLSEGFEKVIIVSQNVSDKEIRPVPANCELRRIDLSVSKFQKIGALAGLFDPRFRKERDIIKKVYNKKLNKGIVSTMLISLCRAEKVERYAKTLRSENQADSKLFFYSYWCDDVALGLAMIQREHPEVRTFSRIHRWDVYFEESEFNYLPFRHCITENISKIFSISQDGINYALHYWKTNREGKFELSRLGINNAFPLEFSDNNPFLIVSCSNLIPVKRVHLIVEALKEIKDVEIKWVHIGDGPDRNKLSILIDQLSSNILVELRGRIPNSEIYNYYAENRPDLFINMSSSEGVPVSIMEAMSFGIPVIATDVGGNAEIVNEENGKLLPINPTCQMVSAAIIEFIEISIAEHRAKRKAAFENWQTEYRASKNYNDFVSDILRL